MNTETLIYGYIRPARVGADDDSHRGRAQVNDGTIKSLPSVEDGALIFREMFSMPPGSLVRPYSDGLIHLGMIGRGIEYEWESWMREFESLLYSMYWETTIVHLQTELSGNHTFSWESRHSDQIPLKGDLSVRCEWLRESALA
ncbi:MAG: hypothetical protein V7744_12975 [Pseudomonadales bacterium]